MYNWKLYSYETLLCTRKVYGYLYTHDVRTRVVKSVTSYKKKKLFFSTLSSDISEEYCKLQAEFRTNCRVTDVFMSLDNCIPTTYGEKLDMPVDIYMLMLVSITLAVIQDHSIYAHASFDYLGRNPRSQLVGRGKIQRWIFSTTKPLICINLLQRLAI